jgi:hypothetical protein
MDMDQFNPSAGLAQQRAGFAQQRAISPPQRISKSPKSTGKGFLIAIVVLLVLLIAGAVFAIVWTYYYPANKNQKQQYLGTIDVKNVKVPTANAVAGAGMQNGGGSVPTQRSAYRPTSNASQMAAANSQAGPSQAASAQVAPAQAAPVHSGFTSPGFEGSTAPPMQVADNTAMFPTSKAHSDYLNALQRARAQTGNEPNYQASAAPASYRGTIAGEIAAGGGDVERSLAATMGLTAAYPDQTGKLPPVIYESSGPTLAYAAQTPVRGAAINAFSDGNLALIDPEGAAKLDRALSPNVPAVWAMDEKTADDRKKAELMKAMMLNGAVDPSLDDIMSASAPYVANAAMARRALLAQSSLDRNMIMEPALRFLYQAPLYRPAVVTPTMSPMVADTNGLTPGQENYLMSINCANDGLPMTQEPY